MSNDSSSQPSLIAELLFIVVVIFLAIKFVWITAAVVGACGLAMLGAEFQDNGLAEGEIAEKSIITLAGLVPFILALSILSNINSPTQDKSLSHPEAKKSSLNNRGKVEKTHSKSQISIDRNIEKKSLNNDSGQVTISAKDIAKSFMKGCLWLFLVFLLAFPLRSATREGKMALLAGMALSMLRWFSDLGLMPFRFLSKSNSSIEYTAPEVESGVMRIGHEEVAVLTDSNLNYHTQIIGGSGAGKTNLLKVIIEDRIQKGHSVIFFDFKADIELMDWITGAVEFHNRMNDLKVVTMSDPQMSHAYNPIAYGDETEITSQIINSLTWSEEFYKNTAEHGLLILVKSFCYLRDSAGMGEFDIRNIYSFLTDSEFRMGIVDALNENNYPNHFRSDLRRLCEDLSSSKRDNYQGLVNQFSKILNSSAGEIVADNCGQEDDFSFRESIQEGGIAYLFMNSLKLKETASIVGKLMLQDLMKTVGSIYDDRNFKKRSTTLIIDEFASFATPDFGEFIEKARGAGISVIVAYQSRQSLNSIEGDLALKLNENTATKIVFQVQDSDDAEWFCSLLGTKSVEKETRQTQASFIFSDQDTGMKSVREVEEYIIHPNELKSLGVGQALLVCSKIDTHFGLININLANYYSKIYERKVTFSESVDPEEEPQKSEPLKVEDIV